MQQTVPPTTERKLPRAGSSWNMLTTWTTQEILLLLREPVAIFFSLVFPIVIFIFIGVPFANEDIGNGVRFIDAMFPSLAGTVGANLLLMGLPIYVAELRSKDVDKRYRAMPLPGWVFGAALVISTLALVIAATALIVGLVAVTFGLRSEVIAPSFLILFFGFIAMLCPWGLFLGTLPFSPRAIQAITAGVFFVMFFGSGAAAPIDGLPEVIKTALEFNPLKIWFDAMVSVYVGHGLPSESVWKILVTLAVSALLLVIGLKNWKKAS